MVLGRRRPLEARLKVAADPIPLLRALVLAALVLLVWEPGRVPLFEPDEGRYAEIPREMLATGDFVTPRLDGALYFEKPPLYYWAVAASEKLLGHVEVAARVPNKLASLGMVLLAYLFARKRWGERVALLSALVLATSVLFFALARISIIDPCLSLALAGAFFAFAAYQEAEGGGDARRARHALYGLHVACAAAVMLKGLVGIVLPGGAILVFCAITGRWRIVPKLFAPGPLALFLALAVPWHVLVARRNPGFFHFYFVHEHFQRFATDEARRPGSPLYFVGVLLGGFIPWTGFFGRLREAWPGRTRGAWRARGTEGFLFVSSILLLAFFSASKSKLIPYLEPIWPAVAVLLALGIERARERGARFGADLTINAVLAGALLAAGAGYARGAGYAARFGIEAASWVVLAALAAAAVLALLPLRRLLALRVALPFLVFFAAALAAFPRAARVITPWPLVSEMRDALAPDVTLVQYGHYLEAAPWYAERLTPVSGLGWSELDFGRGEATAEERARLFPPEEAFARLWNGPGKVLAIVHRDRIREWGRGTLRPFRILAADGPRKHYLLSNS